MATLEEIESAIRVADKAGRKDDVQALGAEWQRLKAAPAAPAAATNDVPAAPSFEDRVKASQAQMAIDADPMKGMSRLEKLAAGNTQNLVSGGRAVKQFVNWASGNRIFDKDKLEKEVADAEKIDKPLLADPWGRTGQIAGQAAITAPFMLAGAAPAAAAAPVTLGINALREMSPAIASRTAATTGIGVTAAREAAAKEAAKQTVGNAMAKSAATGAVEGALTTPQSKDYSPNMGALYGAGAGALGEAGGRALGTVISPAVLKGNDLIQAQIQRLMDAGYPISTKNLTNSPMIHGLSDTLEQLIPGFGTKGVTKAQDKLYTKTMTRAAGGDALENVGAATGVDMMKVPTDKFAHLRSIPGEVNIGGLRGELENFLQGTARLDAASGKGQGAMLPNVVKNLGDTRIGAPVADASRGPGILNTIDQMKMENGAGVVTPRNNTLGETFMESQRPGPAFVIDSDGTARAVMGNDWRAPPPTGAPGRNAASPRRPPEVGASVDQGGAREMGASGIQGTVADAAAQTERAGIPTSMTRDEIMSWRLRLQPIANGPPGTRDREQAKMLLTALENEYRLKVPQHEADLFDQAKREFGVASDVVAAADPKQTIPLKAGNVATKTMTDRQRNAPKPGLQKLTMDLADRQGKELGGWPRAAYIAALSGGGYLGGSQLDFENSPLGSAAGVAVPAAAMFGLGSQSGRKYLMNDALSPLAKELMAKLLATGGTAIQR
jgi:hypothetical protein